MKGSQRKVYDAIKQYWADNGLPPSIRELCSMTNIYSTATVHHWLTTLRNEGYIHWRPGQPRSIKLAPDMDVRA
jgi:repressor LexA